MPSKLESGAYMANCRNYTVQGTPLRGGKGLPAYYNVVTKEITIEEPKMNHKSGRMEPGYTTFKQDSPDPTHQAIWKASVPYIQEFERMEFGEDADLEAEPESNGNGTAPLISRESHLDDTPEDVIQQRAAEQIHHQPPAPRQSTRQPAQQIIVQEAPQTDISTQTIVAVQRQTLNVFMGLLEKHIKDEDDGDWNIINNTMQFNEEIYKLSPFAHLMSSNEETEEE